MAIRKDEYLNFLGECTNEELELLFNVLAYDTDKIGRFLGTLKISEEYKKYGTDYSKYWERIAEELQLFGGNTLTNGLWRLGSGVEYKKILEEVCQKLKLNVSSVENMEKNLLEKIAIDFLENMSEEERINFFKEIECTEEEISVARGSGYAFLIRMLIKRSGFSFYKMSVIIANALVKQLTGKGLSLAANAGLTRGISILIGPIGMVVTGAWALNDLAGPAFRVTIPACAVVAVLRMNVKNREKETYDELADELKRSANFGPREILSFIEKKLKIKIPLNDTLEKKIKEMEEAVMKIGFAGATGSGKSSICNAIYGKKIFETAAAISCTIEVQKEEIKNEKTGKTETIIYDFPGYGDNRRDSRIDEKIEKEYKKYIEELDICIIVIKSEDKGSHIHYKKVIDLCKNKGIPYCVVISQIDKLTILEDDGMSIKNNWINDMPTPELVNEIRKFAEKLRKDLDVEIEKIIPVAALQKKYGIKYLTEFVIIEINSLKKIAFAKNIHEGYRSTKIIKECVKSVGGFIVDAIEKVSEFAKDAVDFTVDSVTELKDKIVDFFKFW